MRVFALCIAILALFHGAAPAQAQSVTQAQIDAATECSKPRDLAEGDTMVCACKARGFDRFIWGTGPYSGHSDICTAARHAGVISKDEGGTVLVTGRPGQKKYEEGEANGIKGRRWGTFRSSFEVTLAKVGGDDARSADALLACQAYSVDAAPYVCSCPAETGKGGSVWGSGPYTGDSDVCTAARHAGVINKEGGPVQVSSEPGQSSYEGSEANGVVTSKWGSYDQSFMVSAPPAEIAACGALDAVAAPYQCRCPAASGNTGSVWGTGPYTGDSDICSAARHAGAVPEAGGVITITLEPGQTKYAGSTENGVTSRSWGAYDQSFMPSAASDMAATAGQCETLPADADTLSCSCPAATGNSGSVWGSGPYTADSDICTAARHAGAVGDQGGLVKVMRVPGLQSYTGSAANGAKTGDWSDFDSSIIFDRN